MNNIFVITLAIIIIGYLLKKIHLLEESDGRAISKLLFNFTIPALLINNFANAKLDPTLGLMPFIAIFYNLIMLGIGLFLFRNYDSKRKGLLTILLACSNGIFFFPLVESLLGSEGLRYFGMYDVGVAFTLFAIVYNMAAYFAEDDAKVDFKKIGLKIVTSAPLMTYTVVISLTLLGLQMPEFIMQLASIISKANTPITFILFGLYLDFHFDADHLKYMAKVIGLRYGIGLIVGLSILFWAPVDPIMKYVLLCSLILPTPAIMLPIAVEFEYDVKLVAAIGNITIVLSFFILWILSGTLPKL